MNTEETIIAGFGGMVFLALIIITIVGFIGVHIQTGEGEHTGIVTATETNGLFFKTHKAYMKTNTQSSQEDVYCVIGDDVYEKLQKLTTSGGQATVQYINWLSKGVAYCGAEQAGVIIGVR